MKKIFWLPMTLLIILLLMTVFFLGQKTAKPKTIPAMPSLSAESQKLKRTLESAGLHPQEARYWTVVEE